MLQGPQSVELGTGPSQDHRGRDVAQPVSASDEGWRALPLAATFQTEARNGGFRIRGEVRDDVGWDSGPPQQFIEDEVRTRGAALLRRARAATS